MRVYSVTKRAISVRKDFEKINTTVLPTGIKHCKKKIFKPFHEAAPTRQASGLQTAGELKALILDPIIKRGFLWSLAERMFLTYVNAVHNQY